MKTARWIASILWMLLLCGLALAPATTVQAAQLDKHLEKMADGPPEMVGIIVQTFGRPTDNDKAIINAYGGDAGASFESVNAFPARVPSPALKGLAHNPHFSVISVDAPMQALWDINATGYSVGAFDARSAYGVNGYAVGVAVIDSGVANHPDFKPGYGNNTVKTFVDFVNPSNKSLDDPYGHGTHVAGLVAGNGSIVGLFTGMAPGANIHALRILDGSGSGSVSNVLKAFDWVKQNAPFWNIRVVNLSLGHRVYESYKTDPLCQAVQSLAQMGIVVVAAAGNYGKDSSGAPVYGGILSPANSPSALTVGAVNPRGTRQRSDDVMATFSSRGPTYIDNLTKPDVVAPGVFLASVESANSYFSTTYSDLRVESTLYGLQPGEKDYLLLSGTSMAAPVVSGIAALMLQKNPGLTPNLVKGILQYTSQNLAGYDVMTQGAGYVNAVGALEAASKIAGSPGTTPSGAYWLSSPLSGQSTIAGEAVIWTGYEVWGTAVYWGGALDYNFTSLYSLAIIWGGAPDALTSQTLLDAGVTSTAVLWNFTVSDQAVLWNFSLTESNVVYGEGYVWGGDKGGHK
jgi:subtilisin family serine protease